MMNRGNDTERERAEEALRESEEQHRMLVETVQEGIGFVDAEERITYCNLAYAEIFELAPEELTGRSLLEFLDDEQRQKALEQTALRKNGVRSAYEITVTTGGGNKKHLSASGAPIMDERGRLRGAVHAIIDITERKRAEEALQASEERFRRLVEQAADALFVHDLEGRFVSVNRQACESLGYTQEELLNLSVADVEENFNSAEIPKVWEEVVTGVPFTLDGVHRRKDGTRFPVEVRVGLFETGTDRLILAVARDITERKCAEEELQKSESRRLAAQRIASVGNWSFDVAANKAYWSDELYRIFGLSAQEEPAPTYRRFLSRVHHDDRALVREASREALDGGSRSSIDYRAVRPDGKVRFAHSQYEVRRDASGWAVELIGTLQDVTERKLAQRALLESEERYRQLVELSPEAVTVHSEGKVVYANEAAARLVGAACPEELIGRPIMEFAHPDYRERIAERIREAFATGKPIPLVEEKIVRLDGGVADVEVTGVPTVYGDKPAIQLLARDIRERKQAEEALRRSEERFRSLAQNASDVVAIIGPDAITHYVSPPVERILGYKPEELIGANVLDLIHPNDLERKSRLLAQVLSSPGTEVTSELRLCHADGSWRYVEAVGKNLIEDPSIGGIVVNYRDITERKAFEEQLKHQAFHDPLTDLPNRTLFVDRLEHALASLERAEGKAVAVLFVDLDDFKVVNDSLGHTIGDHLLVAVAGRVRSRMRPDDTVARFGGDEFAVLIKDVEEVSEAVQVAERILKELQTPFNLGGREVFVSPSIGISLGTTASDRAEDLLRKADTALYQAKARGKARHAVFDSSMYATVLKRLRTESDLRRAMERGEFRIYYQPKMKLGTDLQSFLRFSGSQAIVARKQETTEAPRIEGTEALVRWEHPELGLVSPKEFVPVAEETGMIVDIGRWVLKEACLQTRRWNEQSPDDPPLTVCVNLSARQFQDPGLCQDVARTLQETGLNPRCLSLEITESAVMKDVQGAIATLRELKGLGVELSVDDFGTGYSSLSYLKRFPMDYLKIDRSFVEELKGNAEDAMLVSGIIRLAHTLGMQVVAEGVESAEQLQRLQGLGCDLAQGHYFSKPLPGEAVPRLLAHARQG